MKRGMTASDLKLLEDKGMFAQGYELFAYDADAEQYLPVTGILVSPDGLIAKLQTDSDEDEEDKNHEDHH